MKNKSDNQFLEMVIKLLNQSHVIHSKHQPILSFFVFFCFHVYLFLSFSIHGGQL